MAATFIVLVATLITQSRSVGITGNIREVLPLYLDSYLFYNTTAEELKYDITKQQLVVKDVRILKFKFDGADEEVGSQDSTSKLLTRQRRNVFGKDNRYHVTHRFVEEFPFQTIVRLGNGCTGTLIWHQHVLTSAHCVHDRTKYNPPLKKLRIGLLRTDGTFKWFGAKNAFVPNAWIKKKGMIYLNHDYAVVELDRPHGRRWLPFGVYEVQENEYIQFAGFPSDKQKNQMWYSYCSISQLLKHVFLNYCDATPGMSGSGVYVYNKHDKHNRKIVAVFSSYVQYRKYGHNNFNYDTNVATRLTAKKVRRICKWMAAGYNCYKMRSVFEGERRRYL